MATKKLGWDAMMELVAKDKCKLPTGKVRVFNVTFDLKSPGGDYRDLEKEIRKRDGYCHALQSTWFVATNDPAALVKDLQKHLQHVDRMIVIEMHRADVQFEHQLGLVVDCEQWLAKVLP